MFIMIIGNFFTAYVLPQDIFAWSHIPGKSQNNDFMQIYSTSFFLMGYYVSTHIAATTWEGKTWKLTFINLGYHFASFFLLLLSPSKWEILI